jgi:ribonuclease HI
MQSAEYHALIKGLKLCASHTRRRVTCHSDSELLIKQMTGVYRLKNAVLLELYLKVKSLEQAFEEVVYHHLRRTNQFIRRADRLVNEALNGQ